MPCEPCAASPYIPALGPSKGGTARVSSVDGQRFGRVYIFLDALDESPRDKHRESVLDAVKTMREWEIPGLHFLVTSRDEADLRRVLRPASDSYVSLKNDAVESDISIYICDILKSNSDLQRWERYHAQIQEALLEHAQGL